MEQVATATKPMWKKVWDFPLVAIIVAIALVAGWATIVTWVFGQLPENVGAAAGRALPSLAAVVGSFVLYKLVIRRLGWTKRDDLALPGAARQFLLGVGGGFAIMSITVGIAALLGIYRVVAWEMGDDFAMILFQGGITAGFIEELLFRGILFRWFEELGGSWVALALTSILFGLAHASNDGATVLSTVAIMFEAGILLGACYMYARSLWLPIGVHFAWNVTEGFIYDVPVSGHQVEGLVEAQVTGPEYLSGGMFGLEASIIALLVCTASGLFVLALAVRKGQVLGPAWRNRKPQSA